MKNREQQAGIPSGETQADLPSEQTNESERIAFELLEYNPDDFIIYLLNSPKNSVSRSVALKLIEAGRGGAVAENLDKFTGLDKEIALKLIEAGRGNVVAYGLDKFTGLDKEIALKLIEAGRGNVVAYGLDKFTGLDHKEIALKLIEAGEGYAVAFGLDKFMGLDHKEIALKLIEAGEGYAVANNLDKFAGLDHKEIALKLIEAGKGGAVANNLDKFTGLDKEIALKLIEAGKGDAVAFGLDKFTGLDKEIALKLIEAGKGDAVANNLDKFTGLDKEIALELFEAGQGDAVAKNLHKFTGLDRDDIEKKHPDFLQNTLKRIKELRISEQQNKFYDYKDLLATLKFLTTEERLQLCPFEYEEAVKQLNSLTEEECWETAGYLGDCMELLDFSIDPGTKEKIKKELENKKEEEPQRTLYEKIELSNEIISFYVDSFLQMELTILENEIQKKELEPSFRGKMKLYNLKNIIERENKDKFEWIKQYLVKAVHSELSYQNIETKKITIPNKFFDVQRLHFDVQAFLKSATHEQIIIYLRQAIQKFNEGSWTDDSYGGKMWARIAEGGLAMWKEKSSRLYTVLIDYIIDLEHNTGMVFDKDKRGIKYDKGQVKRILDIKNKVETFEELLEYAGKELNDNEFLEELIERKKTLDEIRGKLRLRAD